MKCFAVSALLWFPELRYNTATTHRAHTLLFLCPDPDFDLDPDTHRLYPPHTDHAVAVVAAVADYRTRPAFQPMAQAALEAYALANLQETEAVVLCYQLVRNSFAVAGRVAYGVVEQAATVGPGSSAAEVEGLGKACRRARRVVVAWEAGWEKTLAVVVVVGAAGSSCWAQAGWAA